MSNRFKKLAFALTLGAAFVVLPGLSTLSTVQAQDGRWQRRNDRNRDGVIDRYEIDRNQNGVDDRMERRGADRNRNGVNDRYENGRYGRNDRHYGNGGYYGNSGYNNAEFQKGYRDGLDRGMKDARTNRAMDPNNSSHYQKGNPAYRAGFERGFFENYRRYSGRSW